MDDSSPGHAVQLKAGLRGMSYDQQRSALAPGSPVQTKAAHPSVQMREAPAAGGADADGFVGFDTHGDWNAADVLAKLGTIPQDMSDAIVAGPKATARYCAALRDRVNAVATGDARKKTDCDEAARALTSRITELFFATPQSPLTYGQLRKVAEYQTTLLAGSAATPAAEPKPEGPKAAAVADPVEGHALELASREGFRVPGEKDEIRRKTNSKANDVEENNPQFPGWRFVRDPFDNTVTAVRPDGTGTQYAFKVVASDTGNSLVLDHKEELSALRVGALARLDKAGLGETQEDDAGRRARIAGDQAKGEEKRAEWGAEHPKEYGDYQASLAKWQADKADLPKGAKAPPPPRAPAGLPANKMTTACTNWPAPVYRAAGGAATTNFSFTPPTGHPGWCDAMSHPEGPKPGDLYWLYDLKTKQTTHMGVVKSRISIGQNSQREALETWTVTDGGQGGYLNIQEVQERTRGPYNTVTRVFSSHLGESGQSKGDRGLTGWIDIDKQRESEKK